jgi:8-oxo-dGTP diphosphatase
VRRRVLAYVTRERDGGTELLVFDHRDDPDAGTQVPAGRVDSGETLAQGVLRELHEEAGLEQAEIIRELPILGDWAHRDPHDNHAFEVRLRATTPDSWEHVVHGDGEDAGMVFVYRWVQVDDSALCLWRGGDPTYRQLA